MEPRLIRLSLSCQNLAAAPENPRYTSSQRLIVFWDFLNVVETLESLVFV